MNEEWRDVVGYEGRYLVSSFGRIKSLLPRTQCFGEYIRQHPTRWGYLNVNLHLNSKSRKIPVHILVAAAFIGPRPNGLETRHMDGDCTNNKASNLKYGTKAENAQDCLRHGHHNSASITHCPKGHPYDEENTGISDRGNGHKCRYCRECKRIKRRKRLKMLRERAVSLASGI